MPLDIQAIRARFPALARQDVFLDNPGGTQIARPAIERMNAYLVEYNANHGGAFSTSRRSDDLIAESRQAMADFLNAARPEEVVFGPNMTSLTFALSRALARTFEAGDEIVLTRLDHDANITPWRIAAEERGCRVRWVDFRPEEGTLDMDSLVEALDGKPKLVAVGYASNALGTINPMREIVRLAHAAGARVYVDAVHYAPHGPIDVQALECDFLCLSAYKFFGPHIGALYGRFELLKEMEAYKVRPAPDDPPEKWETGTQNHEGVAGLLGALEYLEWVGENFGEVYLEKYAEKFSGRRLRLKQAMAAVRAYEYELSRALLDVLEETPGVTIYGPTDVRRLEERVPTVSFRVQDMPPRRVAETMGKLGIYLWDGNYYALSVTERLGVEESGGMVRVGAVHYNTLDEIERFGRVLGGVVT